MGRVGIDIILSEEQHTAFQNAMADENYRCIDKALEGIRSENATATIAADLEAIRALVKSKPGGFEQLNITVRHHLADWFENQGTIRTNVRTVGQTVGHRPQPFRSDTSVTENDHLIYDVADTDVVPVEDLNSTDDEATNVPLNQSTV